MFRNIMAWKPGQHHVDGWIDFDLELGNVGRICSRQLKWTLSRSLRGARICYECS